MQRFTKGKSVADMSIIYNPTMLTRPNNTAGYQNQAYNNIMGGTKLS